MGHLIFTEYHPECELNAKNVSPELLLHILQGVARDNKHLIHVISQHVAGVANVHCCL